MQMGSLEERAVLELEEHSLVNPGSVAGKIHSFKLSNGGGGGSDDISSSNSFIESIKIVVFSTRLNILMIFGPIAIIVDKTSSSRVSLCLFSCVSNVFLQQLEHSSYCFFEFISELGFSFELVGNHSLCRASRFCNRVCLSLFDNLVIYPTIC